MAKVKVGTHAVSRYHQLQRIFPTNDQPNLSDHDFPISGYLLNVSGHMFLTTKDKKRVNRPDKTEVFDGLVSASFYDSETPASKHNFDAMYSSENSISLLSMHIRPSALSCERYLNRNRMFVCN